MKKNIYILKNLISLILIFCINYYTCSEAYAKKVLVWENNRHYKASFPAGMFFKGTLQYKISTKFNNVGDTVKWILPNSHLAEDITFIPAGSIIEGKIYQLKKPQIGRNGFLQIMVDKIYFPDGRKFYMTGHIWTRSDDGIIGGESTKREGFRRTVHYIKDFGAVGQVVPHGQRAMGKHTEMNPGTEWFIVLDEKFDLIIDK